MIKAETEKGKHTRIEMSGKFSAADYFKAAIVAGFKTGLTEFKKHEENAHETVD